MHSITLTPRLLQCMRVIQDLTDATGGAAPSLEIIAGQLGLKSKSSAFRLVGLLVERGHIERLPGRKHRAYRLIHLLPPVGPSPAVIALIKALALAVPTSDGEIRVTMPAVMVTEAARELGVTNGADAR